MKPSWDDAPEWASWLVKDEDDMWYFCEFEPQMHNSKLLLDLVGNNTVAGEFKSPCGTLFIFESRDGQGINATSSVGLENRIGLREESIDWEAHKSFGRSL